MLSVKIEDRKGSLRRIGLPKTTLTSLPLLIAKLGELNISEPPIAVAYRGDQGALVPLRNDADCERACQYIENQTPQQLLRLVITDPHEPEPEPEPVVDVPSVVMEPSDHYCSACEEAIKVEQGYYKCLFCHTVHLCENCEQTGNKHPASHLLVKLRTNVADLSLDNQIVLLGHIKSSQERIIASRAKVSLQNRLRDERRKIGLESKQKLLEERRERQARMVKESKKYREELFKKKNKKVEENGDGDNDVIVTFEDKEKDKKLPSVEESAFFIIEDINATEDQVKPVVVVEEPKAIVEVSKEDAPISSPTKVEEPKASVEVPKEKRRVIKQLKPISRVPLTAAKKEEQLQQPLPATPVSKPVHPFQQKLDRLEEMGFSDRDRNISLLVKHMGNLEETVAELMSPSWVSSIFSNFRM